ncbi:MAG: hypothetical protein AAF244_01300 [Pseudomonadota bacterium]
MARWSLSNRFQVVSHSQFQNYVSHFLEAVEEYFTTPCDLDLRVLTQPEVYTTFYDESLFETLKKQNDANTILLTNDLSEITASVWSKAGYVGVTVRPENDDLAPRSAFATAEFKGVAPKAATFYVQPDGEDVRKSMLEAAKWKKVGDGYNSNGVRSSMLPTSLLSSMPKSITTRLLQRHL